MDAYSSVAAGPRTFGMRVEKTRIVLGTKHDFGDGPEPLLHELAHFIEIDEPRLGLPNWGLKNSNALNAFTNKRFARFPDLEREFRVCAIQKNLHQHFGVPFDVRGTTLPLQHLTGWWNWKAKHGSLFGEGCWPPLYAEIEKLAKLPAYTPATVLREFERCAQLLERAPNRLRPEHKKQ
jgi:hypothetical protein